MEPDTPAIAKYDPNVNSPTNLILPIALMIIPLRDFKTNSRKKAVRKLDANKCKTPRQKPDILSSCLTEKFQMKPEVFPSLVELNTIAAQLAEV
ncbi:hypothetical protein DPMN_152245 [Dreissena polymorpha]|uniref:Uncharacterized protein n=1 Tax=Dreissena polymorpha TaxID=45954 RepID=A0A9D4FJ60_DREPO|nr:hypothetical protein DPMN_152245 [Dreissena polymorpha]